MARAGLVAAVLAVFLSTTRGVASSADWFARVWRTEDGLPGSSVVGIAQTPDGYLWIGTDGGLVRFDGARFQEFSPANLQGVPNRVIRLLFRDRQNRLWLAMDRGPVVCAETNAATVFTLADGLPDRVVMNLADDEEGGTWLAYARGDMFRIKDRALSRFGVDAGLPAPGRLSVATDAKGVLWFARGRAVGVFRQGRFQTLASLSEQVQRIAPAQGGGLWICGTSRLWKYQEGKRPQAQQSLPEHTEAFTPTVLLEDRAGAVWLGTAEQGLFRSQGGPFEPAPTSHKSINCLLEDREGNLWVGTSGGGLDQLRPRAIELLSADAGLPFESVRSVCEDSQGATWLVTQNGTLIRQQGTNWFAFSDTYGFPGGHGTCVASDRAGAIWIGTRDRGLFRFQQGEFTIWDRSNGLGAGAVRSLLASSNGDLWLAMDSPVRLQQLHDGKLNSFNVPKVRVLRAMAEDAAGNIWLGTSEGELLRVTNNAVADETPGNSMRLQSIRSLHGTPDGSLWIGYAGWGLGRLKAGRYSEITTDEGLNDNYISQIVSDDKGWLWLGGTRGLFRVRLEDLQAVAEGHAGRLRSIVYGRGDGLASFQASYDNSPAAIRGSDGRLRIATRSGLVVIHTENIRDNPEPPPVLLERVMVDGQTLATYPSYPPLREQTPAVAALSGSGRLAGALRPAHRKIEFQFTALGLTAPENVHFRHRLEGFDEDWVESNPDRQASYSRLAAGNYRFRVIACNSAGVWNNAGAALSFEVLPFFWQTWSFQLGVLALFTSAVIALARYVSFRRLHARLRLLEQQAALDKERARIAKDIHDDLGGSLTQVTMLLELALRDRATPDKFGAHVRQSLSAARQMLKSLDETVWAINPRNDTLPHLINYIAKFAVRFLHAADIRCRLDLPEHPPELAMTADVRHNLFLVVKEALNNTVRHGHASEVWLRINVGDEALEISVEDNGCGFEGATEDADADGLRNMRQRMNEMGGQFVLESRPGAGTRISFRLPWPGARPLDPHIRAIAPEPERALK